MTRFRPRVFEEGGRSPLEQEQRVAKAASQ